MNSYSINTGNTCEQLIISNIDVSYEDFHNGNPYNTTFNVKVISGDFSGVSQFECNIKEFINFVEQIKALYDFKLKQVDLDDICYGSNIHFSLDKMGHITISGKIYGNAMEHSLTFMFTTDQTSIEIFCNSLNKDFIIENSHKL
jgi:hypothetical protein